jgi:hypothetical protein
MTKGEENAEETALGNFGRDLPVFGTGQVLEFSPHKWATPLNLGV